MGRSVSRRRRGDPRQEAGRKKQGTYTMTDAERIALAAQRCLETIREYAVRKESE
jgi:hypothetical protein